MLKLLSKDSHNKQAGRWVSSVPRCCCCSDPQRHRPLRRTPSASIGPAAASPRAACVFLQLPSAGILFHPTMHHWRWRTLGSSSAALGRERPCRFWRMFESVYAGFVKWITTRLKKSYVQRVRLHSLIVVSSKNCLSFHGQSCFIPNLSRCFYLCVNKKKFLTNFKIYLDVLNTLFPSIFVLLLYCQFPYWIINKFF